MILSIPLLWLSIFIQENQATHYCINEPHWKSVCCQGGGVNCWYCPAGNTPSFLAIGDTIGVCEFNDGNTDCMDAPGPWCGPEIQCSAPRNQLLPKDLAYERAIDPDPRYVFFVDTGVFNIFPDDRDYLWDISPTADMPDAYMSCPPKNCQFKHSPTGPNWPTDTTVCNQNTSPSTDAIKNGETVKQKWGVGDINTSSANGANNVQSFADGQWLCLQCDSSIVGAKITSDVIHAYFINCYEDQFMFSSLHADFFNGMPQNGVYGARSIWYKQNSGVASTQTFTHTIAEMLKHESTKWASWADYSCIFEDCQLVRDTQVDVLGVINGGWKNGKDDIHGTWATMQQMNNDGWIAGNPNFVGVGEVTMAPTGSGLIFQTEYEFTVDTTLPFYHEGLYVECRAKLPGITGYKTQHSANRPFGINNPNLSDKRYMGPILIQVMEDFCGFFLDLKDAAPPINGNKNGVFNEQLTWTEQTLDIVFPKAMVPTTTTFKLDDYKNYIYKNSDGTLLGNSINQNIQTSDVRCPHLRFEAFTDAAMTNPNILTGDPNIQFSNTNNILLDSFSIQTNAALYQTVYLNTGTIGRTFTDSDYVTFKTDTTGNDLKPDPAGIILNFIVCGFETLSLTPAGMAPIKHTILNTGGGSQTFAEPYTTWFDLDPGPLSHPSCDIERYYLGGCFTPGYEGDEYNNPVSDQISMPSTLAPISTALITVNMNEPVNEKVCMWAETRGGQLQKREIDIEICGTEKVTLNGPNTEVFDMLYRDYQFKDVNGIRYMVWDLDYLNQRFTSASGTCPIKEWDLFDSDGTPLVDSAEIKILSVGTKIMVSTENFDWHKKIYLRNKDLNPNGACNWQCYQDRYPGILGGKNFEEIKKYWLSTDQFIGSKSCLCPGGGIEEIEITLNVNYCNLVKINMNDIANYPDYQPHGNYKWFINQQTSTQPTDEHPQYWIDKFFVPVPAFIQKDMTDRFLSEDVINCPALEYMITKVFEPSTGREVPISEWGPMMSIDKTTGIFTITDFSKILNNWQIHYQSNNEYHSTGTSPYNIVDFTVWKPYVPPNLYPYFKDPIPLDIKIMVYENDSWYDDPELHPDPNFFEYTLPEFEDPENEPTTIEFFGTKPPWITFDQTTRKYTIDKRMVPDELKTGDSIQNVVRIKMRDFYGNVRYYDQKFTVWFPINQFPSFSEPLQYNQTIVCYKNADWYDNPKQYKDPNFYNFTFPGFKDPENETVSQSMQPSKDLYKYGFTNDYMVWDEERKTIMFDKAKISRINELGDEYYMDSRTVPLWLIDEYGNKASYSMNFKIIWIGEFDPYDENGARFIANITDITNTGLVKVMFSTAIETKYFNITRHKNFSVEALQRNLQDTSKWQATPKFPRPRDHLLNVSDLNSSHLEMFVIPRDDRHKDPYFQLEWLNFTWECVFYEYNFMLIQLNFTDFTRISILEEWDTFYLRFKEENMGLWYSKSLEIGLEKDHWELWHPLEPQFEWKGVNTDILKSISSSTRFILLGLFWVCLFLNLIFARSMIYFITLLRTLQMIIHLPMVKIIVPSCVIYLFSYIFPIIQWDIFKDGLFDTRKWFDFDEANLQDNSVMDQMRLLGYKSRNVVANLGSISIFWFLYWCKIFVLIVIKIFKIKKPKIAEKSETLKRVYNTLFRQCFFQEFFLIIIALYIEYLVAGYLQFDRVSKDGYDETLYGGDVVSNFFMVFCFIITLVITPIAFAYTLSQNINMYQQAKFKVRWGSMFEGVRLKSKITACFYLLFIIRRLIFVFIVFHLDNNTGVSMVLLCWMNLAILIYTGMIRPLEERFMNRLEMFNELFVCMITQQMMLFSDWVLDVNGLPDKTLQYKYGIMMNCFLLYYLYINIAVICFFTFRYLRLIIIKLYRLIRFHLYALGPFKLPNDANEIYEDEHDDPLDALMKQTKLKPILFIQYYQQVTGQKLPAPPIVEEQPLGPPRRISRPIVFKPVALPPKIEKAPVKNKIKSDKKKKDLSIIKEEDVGETIREDIQPIELPLKKKTDFGMFMNNFDSKSDGGDGSIPQQDLKKNLDDNLKKQVKNKLDKKDKKDKSGKSDKKDKKDKKDKSIKSDKKDKKDKKDKSIKSDKKDKKDKKGDAKDLLIQQLQKQLQQMSGSNDLSFEGDEHVSNTKINPLQARTHGDPIMQNDITSFKRLMKDISRPGSRQSEQPNLFKQQLGQNPDGGGANSFFSIMTGQQDSQDLKDQKENLDELDQKLKSKLQGLMKRNENFEGGI